MVLRITVWALGLCVAGCGVAGSDADVTLQFVGSQPIVGATVTPLIGNGQGGTATLFAVDPNSPAVVTGDDGGFSIDNSSGSNPEGLEFSFSVPSVEGSAVGQLQWRESYDLDTVAGELEIPQPLPCEVAGDCADLRRPDLTPVMSLADVPPESGERLAPALAGPVSEGLFPEDTWFVSEEQGRRLLRFATVAWNAGDGPLDMIAEPGEGESSRTWQRMWTDSWNFHDRLSGEFIFHPEHDHIHFDSFERYRLLDDRGNVVASSEKVSFCLRDSVRIAQELPSATGSMLVDDGNCTGQQQVINPGFGDHYHALLEDQWIDITGVPAGDYVVEVTVDPADLIVESNEDNNTGTFAVVIADSP